MTREQWKERLPLIQAFVDGKDVRVRGGQRAVITFTSDIADYSIIEPPKRVPWNCIEDVKLDAWYRPIGGEFSSRIQKTDGKHIWLCGAVGIPPHILEISYEYSTDLKTWHPCTKEVGGTK